MVCNVLCKYNECNGDVCNGDRADVCAEAACVAEVVVALECFNEREVREPLHILEKAEINDFQRLITGVHSDEGENCSDNISCADTDDEGDKAHHFLTENGAYNDNSKCDDCTDEAYPCVSVHNKRAAVVYDCAGAFAESIADRVAGKGKTDYRDRGSDNCRRHEAVDPINADQLNKDRDNDINKSREYGTDYESEISG